MIGTNLSHFHITAKLGEGGMGEVYRAEDTKLGRQVAIKVLPEIFTQDPERLARFEREAKVLASLNHPHIAAIYSFESAAPRESPNGPPLHFLVMELVEGEDLAHRLQRGAIPIEDALLIARQIAEALEAAHAKGIVHRDLKPQNVKLTPAGAVKVLDFGLAKAMEPTAETSGSQTASPTLMNSPTLTAAGTQLGVILGTAAYMAPEQAKGQPVDKRADIWAFGVLTYEMLTGRGLFAGDSVPETLAGVLKTEVDFAALPAATPVAIGRLLRRCLERDPTNRLHDIADARIEIDAARDADAEAPAAAPGTRRGPWIAGMALAALLGALAAWQLKPVPPQASWKLNLAPPADIGEPRLGPRIAPGGRSIAYLAADRLWVQELDRFTPRPIPNSEGASTYTWSPDGDSLAFTVRTQLWRTLPSGDSKLVAELPEASSSAGGVAWLADGTLVTATGNGGFLAVPGGGGAPRSFLEPARPRESDFHEPRVLPDGRGLIFVVHRDPEGTDTLELFAEGQRRTLYQQDGAAFETPVWSPSGHVLFGQMGGSPGVWALPVDSAALEVSGEPFLVAAGVSSPSVSLDGTLLLSTLTGTGQHQLSVVDFEGRIVKAVGEAVMHADSAVLAPDGKRLAVCLSEAKTASVWIYDLERGSRSRLWADIECGGKDAGIVWSSDGERLVAADHSSTSILIRLADGSDKERLLTEGKQPNLSVDGRFLVFSREDEENRKDLWMLDLEGGEPTPILATAASEEEPRISPDGRYLAYVSDESGRNEVYLRRFPEGSGRWQVSTEGGDFPRWSGAGDRLFFIQDVDRIMVAEVELQATPVLGNPRLLFSATAGRFGPEHGYDVAPDGESLVMVALGGGSLAGGDLTLISPWPEASTEN